MKKLKRKSTHVGEESKVESFKTKTFNNKSKQKEDGDF